MIYMSIHPSINPQIYIPIPQTVKAKNAPPPPHQNPHSPPHLLHHALPIPQQRYYPRSSQRSERTYQSACEWDTGMFLLLPYLPPSLLLTHIQNLGLLLIQHTNRQSVSAAPDVGAEGSRRGFCPVGCVGFVGRGVWIDELCVAMLLGGWREGG